MKSDNYHCRRSVQRLDGKNDGRENDFGYFDFVNETTRGRRKTDDHLMFSKGIKRRVGAFSTLMTISRKKRENAHFYNV